MSHLITYFPFECPGAHIRDAGAASVARGPVGLVHRINFDSPLFKASGADLQARRQMSLVQYR